MTKVWSSVQLPGLWCIHTSLLRRPSVRNHGQESWKKCQHTEMATHLHSCTSFWCYLLLSCLEALFSARYLDFSEKLKPEAFHEAKHRTEGKTRWYLKLVLHSQDCLIPDLFLMPDSYSLGNMFISCLLPFFLLWFLSLEWFLSYSIIQRKEKSFAT